MKEAVDAILPLEIDRNAEKGVLDWEPVDIDARYNLPKDVRFCKKCVISNQRPRISFDEEGICSACRYWEQKETSIDWAERELQLRELCDRNRSKHGEFDVLVPSSGGKDSVYVAHILRDRYGMNPLTMTWAPHIYTAIGFRNMQAKIHSGFSNITLFPDGLTHRKMTRISTVEVGDPFQPFIYGQTYLPLKVASFYKIGLIFDGENGEIEYGGDVSTEKAIGFSMEDADEYWLSGFPIDRWLDYGFSAIDTPMKLAVEYAWMEPSLSRVENYPAFMATVTLPF